uniref:Reverse transcriptase domain-containing protein n=1 Tax=Tanacetum cinerariifolium TaxID=118510 RepID=A0A6L2MBF2_TANCI|nr:hypothetical protein [Tanacetum cinerariifolium]
MEDLKQQYLYEMKRLINSEYHDEIKIDELKDNFNRMSIEINKKEKLQQLEQVANLSTYPSKRFNSFCYDDDDDEDYTVVITPDFSITDSLIMENEHLDTISETESDEFIKSSVENLVLIPNNIIFGLPSCVAIIPNKPVDSLSMGDKHLDTVLATESDEFIKSSVENLVPIPSEFEGDKEYFSEEIYSNPLFEEEIIPMKIDPHSFNAESDLTKSMLNHDSSIIISSKIDSLFDDFAGELTLLKSISPGIDETDGEETHFTNDPLMEEIDLSFTPDDPMPPGIEEDDYDSKRDIPILEEFLDNYPLSLPENESYHFNIPPSSCKTTRW